MKRDDATRPANPDNCEQTVSAGSWRPSSEGVLYSQSDCVLEFGRIAIVLYIIDCLVSFDRRRFYTLINRLYTTFTRGEFRREANRIGKQGQLEGRSLQLTG